MDTIIEIIQLHLNTILPSQASKYSVGYDLYACIPTPILLYPEDDKRIPTGIALKPKNPTVAGFIVPRSGLSTQHGIILRNTIGIIDPDYEGEIMVHLLHTGERPYIIEPNERIAQLLFIPYLTPVFEKVETFSQASERGVMGFGSSGRF